MRIQALVPIGVVFVVAFFIFGIGQIIFDSLGENTCDYTWITNQTLPTGANTTSNPVTGAWYGCCIATSGNNCTAWYTEGHGQNATAYGMESIAELADWGPTLALVVIAAIIIGVLVTYLARGSK